MILTPPEPVAPAIPVHQLYDAMEERAAAASDFIEWVMDEKHWVFGEIDADGETYRVMMSRERLLFQFLGLDVDAYREEKALIQKYFHDHHKWTKSLPKE